jgi:excinuclease ABC subunit A
VRLLELGLGYLSVEHSTPTLSPGELHRLRLATQVSNSPRSCNARSAAGLHPADLVKLTAQLGGLVESGNTVIVVEHDMSVVAASDWVFDIGPGAGVEGGRVVACGPPAILARAAGRTPPYLARYPGIGSGRYHQKS